MNLSIEGSATIKLPVGTEIIVTRWEDRITTASGKSIEVTTTWRLLEEATISADLWNEFLVEDSPVSKKPSYVVPGLAVGSSISFRSAALTPSQPYNTVPFEGIVTLTDDYGQPWEVLVQKVAGVEVKTPFNISVGDIYDTKVL